MYNSLRSIVRIPKDKWYIIPVILMGKSPVLIQFHISYNVPNTPVYMASTPTSATCVLPCFVIASYQGNPCHLQKNSLTTLSICPKAHSAVHSGVLCNAHFFGLIFLNTIRISPVGLCRSVLMGSYSPASLGLMYAT